MSTKQIDLLNLGLIIISAVLAWLFPLQLFVLAFAILGPLHYLTEINWLDKKNYFSPVQRNTWLIAAAAASLLIVLPKIYFFLAENNGSFLAEVMLFINRWSNSLIFLTFLLSFGFTFLKDRRYWIALLVTGLIGAILLNTTSMYRTLVGLFIPTVVHVYIFTLLFMLYGSLKARSELGYLTILVALLVPVVFAFIDLEGHHYFFSDEMKSIYLENNFHSTPVGVASLLGLSDGTSFYFYESLELKLMMFISFIYLYHYLNWFSKTTVIGWHKELTKGRAVAIVVLWLILLSLFYYDYRIGFLAALFFSFLHVILEFPLNWVSIRGVFNRK